MTFSEARVIHLEALDNAFNRLRAIIKDPLWCNDKFPKYVTAREELASRIGKIQRLNEAEQEALMKRPD